MTERPSRLLHKIDFVEALCYIYWYNKSAPKEGYWPDKKDSVYYDLCVAEINRYACDMRSWFSDIACDECKGLGVTTTRSGYCEKCQGLGQKE